MTRLLSTAFVAGLCLSWAGPSAGQASADFDGSGKVDFSDFFLFVDAFGTSDPRYDLDGDSAVDFSDFFLFTDSFGSGGRVDRVPVAIAGADQNVTVGATVRLDGSGSSDADGDPLIYRWLAPPGISLSDSTSAQPTFSPRATGFYRFFLVVNDGTVDSTPDTVTVRAFARVTACGQTITQDARLETDLACGEDTPQAIVIAASGVTLDLGGHVLSGSQYRTGIIADLVDSVTVKNGIVDGFEDGIIFNHSRWVTVEDLTVRNLRDANPDHMINGLHFYGCRYVAVRRDTFEFPPLVFHRNAVINYMSEVSVRDIVVRGAGVGVGFGGVFLDRGNSPYAVPSTGEVLDSRFVEIRAAVWVDHCSNVRVAGNDIAAGDGGEGVQVDAPYNAAVTGLVIEGNVMHDGFAGVELRGVTDVIVQGNVIRNNNAWGVAVRHSQACFETHDPGYDECYGSTNNVIVRNQTWGNGIDLYQDSLSTPNIWLDNVCESHEGADIPRCLPIAVSSCGQTIRGDAYLAADLICGADTPQAITIARSGVTLDLGGHVLSGQDHGQGIVANDVDSVTIRNGTVDGFGGGVSTSNCRGVTVEDLTVKHLEEPGPDDYVFGLSCRGSRAVVVQRGLFDFGQASRPSAIDVYSSDVSVNDIEVRGGAVGVNFSLAGVCDPDQITGEVVDSDFLGQHSMGVRVVCGSAIRMARNEITAAGPGIEAGGPFVGAVTGLTIDGNTIHDASTGILLDGVTQSTVSGNTITNNTQWGIAVQGASGCRGSDPGWECFPSHDNLIVGNQMSGNDIDLYHDQGSTPNTWQDNTCETSEGADIPPCHP